MHLVAPSGERIELTPLPTRVAEAPRTHNLRVEVAEDRARTVATWANERTADARVFASFPSVALVASGEATPDIALRLASIFATIGVTDRTSAALWAERHRV